MTWNRADGAAYSALVDLGSGSVTEWEPRPGLQPNFTPDEYHECDEMLRVQPEVVAALARRGITDLSRVLFDVWAYGDALVPEQWRDRRVGWCDVWLRDSARGNPYANFLRGLHLVVDMNALELLEIEDDGTTERPAVMGEYVPDLVPGQVLRNDLRPLEITQPEGVSFTLDGNELRWQRWRMRIGFNYREGLVLHGVGYEDGGRVRPIAHRLTFAEMVVPYRDPTPDHYRRTAFDIGEWGLGLMTSRSSSAATASARSATSTPCCPTRTASRSRSERDLPPRGGQRRPLEARRPDAGAEVRRMRRMVVSFHVTVANYEYLVYWRFYQDGNIECEVRATGIMVTTHFARASSRPTARRSTSTRTRRTTSTSSSRGSTWTSTARRTPSRTLRGDAGRAREPVRGRPGHRPRRSHRVGRPPRLRLGDAAQLEVTNPGRSNAHGVPVAYKLVPTGCVPPLLPASPVLQARRGDPPPALGDRAPRRGALAVRRVPHPERRRPRPAGLDGGRPPDRDTDLVLWYVFGIHHITRAEDWPVMPPTWCRSG